MNLHRRHLDQSQKAMVAVKSLPYFEEEAKLRMLRGKKLDPTENFPEGQEGESRDKAAKIIGVNPHYVTDAKRIVKEAPELADKVRDGELNITDTKSLLESRAEAKLGELLKTMPKPKFDKQLNGSSRGTTGTLPKGITKKQSHYAHQLLESKIDALTHWQHNGVSSPVCVFCDGSISWGSGFKNSDLFLCDLCVEKSIGGSINDKKR